MPMKIVKFEKKKTSLSPNSKVFCTKFVMLLLNSLAVAHTRHDRLNEVLVES